MLLIRGDLVLNNGLSGYIRGEIGNIAATQQEKHITDAQLPTDVAFSNKAEYSALADDYCCPRIYNRGFFSDIGETKTYTPPSTVDYEETTFQHYHRNSQYFVNPKTVSGIVDIPTQNLNFNSQTLPDYAYSGKAHPVTPMLYLFKAIELIMRDLGYYQKYNELVLTDLMNLVIYNNFNIIKYTPHITYYQARDAGWFQIEPILVSTIDYYSQQLGTFSYKNLLPKVTLKQLLLSVQNMLNVAFVIQDDNKYAIVDREAVFQGGTTNLDPYFVSHEMKGLADSVIKFTMKMDPGDAESTSFYQDLTDRIEDFGDDVETLQDMFAITNPGMGELRRVISERKIYEYGPGTITDENGEDFETVLWKFVSIDYQPLLYNKESGTTETIEITTEAGTVPYGLSITNTVTGTITQPGRMNLRKDTNIEQSLVFMFNNAGEGLGYNDNYDLNYRYPNNLFEKRFKRTAEWLATREACNVYVDMPASFIATLNMNKKMGTRHGQFIPDELITKFNHTGPEVSVISGWKV